MSVRDTLCTISKAGLTLTARKTKDALRVYSARIFTPRLAAANREYREAIIKIIREDEEMRRSRAIRCEIHVFELARDYFGLDERGSIT